MTHLHVKTVFGPSRESRGPSRLGGDHILYFGAPAGVGVTVGVGAPLAVLERDSKKDFLAAAGVGEGVDFCSGGFLSWASVVEAASRIDPSVSSVFKMLLLSFP